MQDAQNTCHHCGDECPSKAFIKADKLFCCKGCIMVYELLSESGLEHFYADGTAPGSRVESGQEDRYAYLDESKIAEMLLLFTDGQQSKVRLHLPAIHCSSCLWLLEHLGRLHDGIHAVKVNFAQRNALISFAPERISLRELAELLHRIGYPPRIDLSSATSSDEKPSDKSLLLKIGISGFLFGNIMLLSFPEYLSTGSDLIENYAGFFSYIVIALSLPVLFYCARDFFQSSYTTLRHARLTIDVPIALGISVIFLRSLYDIYMGLGPGYLDSMAGLVFFLLIGRWYQGKVYDSLSFERDFRSFFPLSVERLTGGLSENVPVMELAAQDHIAILGQGIIPADCILESESIKVDYSFVTGESRPVVLRRGESIYAGGRNLSGRAELRVTKKVSQSYLTDLWNQDAFGKKTPSLSGLLDQLSGRFTLAVLSIAVISGIYWAYTDGSIVMDAVTAVLIVACPCALALSVPFALGNARRMLSKRGLFTKNTQAVEKMAKVDSIVFDKTGTLTYAHAASCNYEGDGLTATETIAIASLTAQSAHPHSRIIHQLYSGERVGVDTYSETSGQGIEGIINGQLIRIGSAVYVNAAERSDRESASYVSIDGRLKGRYIMRRDLRAGAAEAIEALRHEFNLIVLSGDNDGEAEMLSPLFKREEMHFHQSPKDKLAYISRLQADGHHVMMIGDGLNDAGALQQANVGIAVADDVCQFTPACDAILRADELATLPGFMRYSSLSIRAVRLSVAFSLIYNIVGISFAVQGLLTPLIAAILMPLSSVTVVGFATLLSSWGAGRMKLNTSRRPDPYLSTSDHRLNPQAEIA